MATKPTFANIAAKAISTRSVTKPPPPQIQIVAKASPEPAALKTPTDDTSTHVSSSESSVKMPSFDKQSVASGTTFAMDEKESLRPDDSASLRAVEDELDGPAGSRDGSDTDARAFSDQLHRIQQVRPVLQSGVNVRPQIQFGQMPMPTMHSVPETPCEEMNDAPNPITVVEGMPAVDEKLLDALASPRDRVFILKIEQDILDFMKSDTEAHLTLPDCNSFYRMLSHRLADYYGLEHTHHPRESGTAVLISKTPQSRLPPALAGIPVAGTTSSSPPPEMTTRKIMRRGEGDGVSGYSTTANSAGASKAASEIGGDSKKDKSNMTREEREKQYAEARLRILGAAEPDPEDASKAANENDLSRTSSASGKKNKPKKRKDDDDFQPRSQFPAEYCGGQGYNPGYGDGSFYFPQYAGGMTTAAQQQYVMQPTASPQHVAYSSGYDPTSPMQYMAPQQYAPQPTSATNVQPYAQASNGQYDLSQQLANMSFGPQNQVSQSQKPGTAPNYPHGQPQQVWPTSPYDSQQYMYAQQQQVYGQYPDRSPGQAQATIPYPYGQLPASPHQGGKMQHPLPGSFNRQQFNPATQAFIPGGAGRSVPMQIPTQVNAYYGQFPMASTPSMQTYRPSSGPPSGSYTRPSPNKSNTNAYPSPAMQQPSQPYVNNGATPTMPFSTMAASYNQGPTQSQPQSYNSHSETRLMPGLGATTGQLAHPLPPLNAQPPNKVNSESSIAKWGTPASLPPKPPTPTNLRPVNYRAMVPGVARYTGSGAPTASAERGER